MEFTRKKIIISGEHVKALAEEFQVSEVTIYNAIKGKTQSSLSMRIRQGAKTLLLKEANKIE